MNVQNGLLPLHATGNEKIIVNSHLFFQNVWKILSVVDIIMHQQKDQLRKPCAGKSL